MKTMRVKIGRNAPCPCGTSLKYKKCCLITPKSQNDLESQRIEKARETQRRKVKRLYNSDILYVDSEPDILKMSEVIIELSRDHIKEARTDSERNTIISLACLAWNLFLLEEQARETEIDKIIHKLKLCDFEIQELRETFSDYFSKIMKGYADVKRSILDYQIVDLGDNFHLNIISSISEQECIENKSLRKKFENHFNTFSEKERSPSSM